VITEDELRSLVGTRFPGGTFAPEPYFNWLTCDAVMAPELTGAKSAHPLIVYMATQAGMGLSLEQLFALCRSSSEDGPMLGEWGMEVHRPVRLGSRYTVSGGITGARRKTGKKTGVFDIIDFELEMREEADSHTVVAVTRSSFIYPRRG
jgi:acyl dehydratase